MYTYGYKLAEGNEERKESKKLRTLRRNGLDLAVLRCEKIIIIIFA